MASNIALLVDQSISNFKRLQESSDHRVKTTQAPIDLGIITIFLVNDKRIRSVTKSIINSLSMTIQKAPSFSASRTTISVRCWANRTIWTIWVKTIAIQTISIIMTRNLKTSKANKEGASPDSESKRDKIRESYSIISSRNSGHSGSMKETSRGSINRPITRLVRWKSPKRRQLQARTWTQTKLNNNTNNSLKTHGIESLKWGMERKWYTHISNNLKSSSINEKISRCNVYWIHLLNLQNKCKKVRLRCRRSCREQISSCRNLRSICLAWTHQ